MPEFDEDFKKFFGFLLLFAFLILFWDGFKEDMARRYGTQNLAQQKTQTTRPVQQKVYRQVYVNNGGGPATVYYIRN